MNSCGSPYCHGGSCTCGLYYGQDNATSAYSMFYNQYQDNENYSESMYSVSPSSSSSVDCTLSLGTPSTRLSTNENEKRVERRSSSYMSKCWNILQNKNHTTPSSAPKSSRGSSNNGNTDSLVARRCANCDITSTPLWRNGPRGPKSLCNACGIRFKKEERRANAAAADTANGGGMEMNGSWVHHSAYGNEFRFIEDDDDDRHDSDNTAISFWPYL
ncbi:GATA transcription factor 18-like [Lycium barbarum]|uniref:GATA transcription factor 18-like n=1 Tax=Lycium barbarum TaxID=112863 RepID=UPI00293F0E82|nr:GATA transcription factor 18-like [Lycium barbarum]